MYEVIFTDSALKELKKLDKPVVRVIKNWVVKNLVDCVDPRIHGKPFRWVDMESQRSTANLQPFFYLQQQIPTLPVRPFSSMEVS